MRGGGEQEASRRPREAAGGRAGRGRLKALPTPSPSEWTSAGNLSRNHRLRKNCVLSRIHAAGLISFTVSFDKQHYP